MQDPGLYKVRHIDHWTDASDNPDRFGQYSDNSDRLNMVLLLTGKTMSFCYSKVYEM